MRKKWYKSKTLWVNVIALAAFGIQAKWGVVVDSETQASVLALLNMGLRTITSEGITG